MKRIAFFLLTLALVFTGCKPSSGDPAQEPYSGASYKGTVTVTYEGEDFDNEGIRVEIKSDPTAGTLRIDIYQIKFVPKMPVTVDVTVPGVPYTEKDGVLTFSGDDIVPLSGVAPVERYRVSGLSGTVIGKDCTFSLRFGSYPTSFSGTEE